LYDQLCHASIRDGIRLSFAQSFSYRHNDVQDLQDKLKSTTGQVFIVTESVFSMDGDIAPLAELIAICEKHGCQLVLDEAHATGVIGHKGEGLAQDTGLQGRCFARVHTFGKAVGTHGAVVLGSSLLRDYLVNFSRPFIYTTALPEACIAAIRQSYAIFPGMNQERQHLQALVREFQSHKSYDILESDTPIQGVVIPGNEAVKTTAVLMQQRGFDVRPILYPTVPKGGERLRIVLHSFNTTEQVKGLLAGLFEKPLPLP
jgi:8-amino-7-oxononanoate synthase